MLTEEEGKADGKTVDRSTKWERKSWCEEAKCDLFSGGFPSWLTRARLHFRVRRVDFSRTRRRERIEKGINLCQAGRRTGLKDLNLGKWRIPVLVILSCNNLNHYQRHGSQLLLHPSTWRRLCQQFKSTTRYLVQPEEDVWT